jgi:actin-like ATPase involved in cell morphogenesis
MSLLQNLTHTLYFQLETLQASYTSLTVDYGLPETVPTGLVVALEHDKTKVDEQHELAGYRKRPRVFVADIYTTAQADRNDITEAIKDLFENKTLPVLDAARQDTGIIMACDGVRVEVDLTQRFKARAKIYVYTLTN